jgi:hypothetical protein
MEHHSQPDERKAQIRLASNRATPVQVAELHLAASAQPSAFFKMEPASSALGIIRRNQRIQTLDLVRLQGK